MARMAEPEEMLDRLSEFDLVRRKTDPVDRRSVLVQRTGAGNGFMRDLKTILANAGKEVLAVMFETGQAAPAVIAQKGLAQVSDSGAIEAAVADVLAKNADQVAKYKAGKTQVLGFFVGQVMKAMKGKGNPQLVNDLIKKKLG